MSTAEGTRLVAFYRGDGVDDAGRDIECVQGFTADALEFHHDYIQWLFPLFERSRTHARAPALDDESARVFRENAELRARLRRSLDVMLAFYGFRLALADPPRVVPAADFEARSRNWITPGNHNFLRITRILSSLSILGEAQLARAFYDALASLDAECRAIIGGETFGYWRRAITS